MDEPASGARRGTLRTADVARESGYSVQQVRDLERLEVIPPAARSGNGYRSYSSLHVRALRAYRGLAGAVGSVVARQLLAELRTQSIAEAASVINEVHVRLAREREEALRAQQALRAIQAEESTAESEQDGDAMTITELSRALGVRPSTLRFWEQEGLVTPERVTSLRARRYGLSAIRAARIVTALRSAGYGVPAVREIMGSLHRLDGRGEARRVLRERLDQIAVRTVELLRAGADLAAVVMAAQERATVSSRSGDG
jgi:DNA-binding transcriptional MerR regulator